MTLVATPFTTVVASNVATGATAAADADWSEFAFTAFAFPLDFDQFLDNFDFSTTRSVFAGVTPAATVSVVASPAAVTTTITSRIPASACIAGVPKQFFPWETNLGNADRFTFHFETAFPDLFFFNGKLADIVASWATGLVAITATRIATLSVCQRGGAKQGHDESVNQVSHFVYS